MMRSQSSRCATAGARICLATLALAQALSGCGSGAADDKAAESKASVTTAIATSGSLASAVTAYATISAAVGHMRTIAMPHEGVVASVAVHDGDSVRAGQALMTISIAPAAATQYAQASSALTLAARDVARLERLRAEKLATNDQLASARKALADARQQAEGLRQTGANRASDTLRAPFAGVVTGLSAVPGDRPVVGAVVAVVSSRKDAVVQLGLEPVDAAKLSAGARVRLQPQESGAAEIVATLDSVGAAVDTTTRLVKAIANIPAVDSGRVTLGTTLVARVDLPARSGLVVPRAALLEDAGGTYLYTVEKNAAHRQAVEVGAQTEEQTLIVKGLSAGTRVITSNNAGLSDGTAVEESAASRESKP